jgi:hypothetical protein
VRRLLYLDSDTSFYVTLFITLIGGTAAGPATNSIIGGLVAAAFGSGLILARKHFVADEQRRLNKHDRDAIARPRRSAHGGVVERRREGP